MPGAHAVLKQHMSRTKRGSRKPPSKTVKSGSQAAVRLGGHGKGANFDQHLRRG